MNEDKGLLVIIFIVIIGLTIIFTSIAHREFWITEINEFCITEVPKGKEYYTNCLKFGNEGYCKNQTRREICKLD